MIGSYRGIIFRLTHNFCALHFVQVPQLCRSLPVIAGQGQTKGLQHKAGVPFPCLILIGCSLLQPLQNQTRAGFFHGHSGRCQMPSTTSKASRTAQGQRLAAIVVRALPRLHNGRVGGGAVFIRLPEPFAAGAGIDHLIQDKMVHIGGSSGIAVFSGFLVYSLRGI